MLWSVSYRLGRTTAIVQGSKLSKVVMGALSLLALIVLTSAGASASCSRKVAMLEQAVARLHDLTTSTNEDQQARDADAIANLYDDYSTPGAQSIRTEDCVGLSKADQNVVDIILTASIIIDSSRDFYKNGRASGDIDFAPLLVQANASYNEDDSSECRCYARGVALRGIFMHAESLAEIWSERTTRLETIAVSSLWSYLDSEFATITKLHLGSSGSRTALLQAERIANAQLLKHCQTALWVNPQSRPKHCKYPIYGVPTPEPTE
jgi:hypothetical protein